MKDLRLRLRDRSALVLGLLAPLVLAFIFNLIFGGAFGSDSLITLGVADADGGQVAAAFQQMTEGLTEGGVIDVMAADTGDQLRDLVDDGTVGAGILLPEGVSEAVAAGSEAELVVIGDVDRGTSQSVASAVAAAFGSGVADVQRALGATARIAGPEFDPTTIPELANRAAAMPPAMTVAPVEAANRVLDPTTFFAASMAVFFVFFLVQFGVTGLLDEQREGTLTRLQAAPVPRWAVVVGKALTSFLLAVIALTVLAVASTFIMGADWGNPVGVALLILGVSAAATSIVGVVAAFARTPEGAGNSVAVIAVTMGMLGGSFFPVAGANRVIEALSRLTPHAWFLQGLGALGAGDGLAGIVVPVLALLAFAIVTGLVATVLLKRKYA